MKDSKKKNTFKALASIPSSSYSSSSFISSSSGTNVSKSSESSIPPSIHSSTSFSSSTKTPSNISKPFTSPVPSSFSSSSSYSSSFTSSSYSSDIPYPTNLKVITPPGYVVPSRPLVLLSQPSDSSESSSAHPSASEYTPLSPPPPIDLDEVFDKQKFPGGSSVVNSTDGNVDVFMNKLNSMDPEELAGQVQRVSFFLLFFLEKLILVKNTLIMKTKIIYRRRKYQALLRTACTLLMV
jgi:hypothetical protein